MYTKALRQTALLMSGLITALTTLVALGMTVMRLGAPNTGGPATQPVTGVREVAPTLAPLPPLRSVRIRAVGDLITHQVQLDSARQADGSYDFHAQYARIAGVLADADYTIANL